MAGLLSDAADQIAGSNDQSTADANGLTEAQRRLVMYGGLTQLGANLLAASQPMYGADRARYLSQIGNVPATMQAQAYNMQQQKLLGLKNQQAQVAMSQAAKMRAVLNSPEFQQQLAGLDPSTAALLRAAAAGGDMATVAKIYDSMQPKMSYSGVVFDPRRGTLIDPYSGTRVSLNGAAAPGEAGGTNSFFPYKRTAGLDPTAVDTQLLNSLPVQIKTNVQAWLDGKRPVPTSSALRDPRIQQQLTLAQVVDPGFDAANYPARAAFLKDMASGRTGRTVDSANKFLNHSALLLQKYDQLGLYNGPLANLNGVLLMKLRGEHDPRLDAVKAAITPVLNEFASFMSGKGELTDQARREYEDKLTLGHSPQEIHAALESMIDLMKGQLQPIADRRREVLKRPDSIPSDFLQPEAIKALDYINRFGSGSKTPEAAEVHSDASSAPPPSAAPASAAPLVPPVAALKEGHDTAFQNGQVWRLVNGKPVRVK